MSKIENPPAFPRDRRHFGHNGMDLRDWFAGQALVGFLSDGSQRLVAEAFAEDGLFSNEDTSLKARVVNSQVAIGCYLLADAMLAERNRAPEATHG